MSSDHHHHHHHHHGHTHDHHDHYDMDDHGCDCCWDASWLIYWICGCVILSMYGNLKYNSVTGSWKLFGSNKKSINADTFWFISCTGVLACLYPKQLLLISLGGSILYGLYRTYNLFVSKPGGPRPAKIVRQPKWNVDKKVNLPNLLDYKCLVDVESHKETLEHYQSQLQQQKQQTKSINDVTIGLSGEPAGRQTWTKSSTHSTTTTDNHELALKWARGGRETAEEFHPHKNPNSCDVIYRYQHILKFLKSNPNFQVSSGTDVKSCMRRGIDFYQMLQSQDGHWGADYGGPHFLMPGLIVAWYIMGKPNTMITEWQQMTMAHYLVVHQQSDGGWGSHVESPSTMFGTVLCYVALCLLWHDKDISEQPYKDVLEPAKKFIASQQGGALCTSSWAKFWLCLLGCMEWEGHNCVPPEMWLLPNWFPFHPGRLWCHCRMVYLPMGYLYGHKFTYANANTDPIIQQLRIDLYTQPYSTIPWSRTRHDISPLDNYSPIPWFMKTVQNILAVYEKYFVLTNYRQLGTKFSLEYMCKEDLQTNYIDIGPVNKVLNMLSMYHASGSNLQDPKVINHMMRVPDYLWMAEDGCKMQGYNGSSCWDTSFAIQAIAEANLLDSYPTLSQNVWSYLEKTQILSTPISQLRLWYFHLHAYYKFILKQGHMNLTLHFFTFHNCT